MDCGYLYVVCVLSGTNISVYFSPLPNGLEGVPKKGKGVKKPRRHAGKGEEEEEAGEETDEGDMEGQEVDYMSRSSSESEEEFQVCVCVCVHMYARKSTGSTFSKVINLEAFSAPYFMTVAHSVQIHPSCVRITQRGASPVPQL